MLKTATGEFVQATETKAKSALALWLEKAGMTDDQFPLTIEQVSDLLSVGGEYAASVEHLRDLQARGQIPAVKLWDARDVVAAATCLEARRDWMPTPSVHDPKKHSGRLAVEQTIQADPVRGFQALLDQLGGLDLQYALVLMCESDSREMREKLLDAVQVLLAQEGLKR